MATPAPIKTFRDRRPFYLQAMERSYEELGYATKLNRGYGTLEIYPKGCIVPKTPDETIIEKWVD